MNESKQNVENIGFCVIENVYSASEVNKIFEAIEPQMPLVLRFVHRAIFLPLGNS